MAIIETEIPDIRHGHGLSFKRGLADGLLDSSEHQNLPHSPHHGVLIQFQNNIAEITAVEPG